MSCNLVHGMMYRVGYGFYLCLIVTHAMMSPDAPSNIPMMPTIAPIMRGVVQLVPLSHLQSRVVSPVVVTDNNLFQWTYTKVYIW